MIFFAIFFLLSLDSISLQLSVLWIDNVLQNKQQRGNELWLKGEHLLPFWEKNNCAKLDRIIIYWSVHRFTSGKWLSREWILNISTINPKKQKAKSWNVYKKTNINFKKQNCRGNNNHWIMTCQKSKPRNLGNLYTVSHKIP